MEVMPGYKLTEVGVIPDEWAVRSIGQVFRLVNGCAFKPEDWKLTGTPIIRIQNLNDPFAPFNFSQAAVSDKNRVEPGDLLFAWSGTLGSSFGARLWHGPAGVLNQHIFKVHMADRQITLPFSLLVFARVEEDIATQAHGFKASFVHVKKADLVKVWLPVPPLLEQDAIASVLGDVNALLAGLERLIAKKRDLKRAAMQQLLTGQTRLPGFQGEWIVKRLGDIAPLQRGFDLPTPVLRPGPYPVVYSNGVLAHHDSYQARGPGVVTGRSGTIGRVSFIADGPYWPHNTALWVTSFKANDPKFVFYLYTHIGFERFASGSGVPTLNRNDAHAFEIAVPATKNEQTAIATVLSDMDAELTALEARRDKTRALKQGMMQELLTGRTRLV